MCVCGGRTDGRTDGRTGGARDMRTYTVCTILTKFGANIPVTIGQ